MWARVLHREMHFPLVHFIVPVFAPRAESHLHVAALHPVEVSLVSARLVLTQYDRRVGHQLFILPVNVDAKRSWAVRTVCIKYNCE